MDKVFLKTFYMTQKKPKNHTQFSVNPSNNLDESTLSDKLLNGPITVKEIRDQISKLKNKITPGTNTLLNEMIKHIPYYLMPSAERIFN